MKSSQLLLLGLFWCFRCAALDNAGMVINVAGPVTVSAAGNTTSPALFSYLVAGALVSVPAGAELSFTLYRSKEIYKLAGPAEARVEVDSVTMLSGQTPTVVKAGEQLVAAANESDTLTAGSYRMRRWDIAITPQDPASRTLLIGDAVMLGWRSLVPGPFAVSLRRVDSTNALSSATTATESFTVPDALLPLNPGTYEWAVSAKSGDGKQVIATDRFQVASADQTASLLAIRPPTNASPEEWALYGKIAQSRGFLQEARTVWRSLASKYPAFQHLPVN